MKKFLKISTITWLILCMFTAFAGCAGDHHAGLRTESLAGLNGFTQKQYGVFLDFDGNIGELSDYEYLVIDARYHDKSEFLGKPDEQHIYSYLNIGSLEDFSDYYDTYSDLALGPYEHWEEEQWVDVSDERWQKFILNELAPEVFSKGIDGFFVDNCDVYYNYPTDEILNGLAVIMKGLRSMGCDVIINGGDAFLDAYTEKIGPWSDVITGINQECVFTRIDWEEDRLTAALDEDREYFTDYIEKYAAFGAQIFLLEYADDSPENEVLERRIATYCGEHGFLYYISDSVNLDR